MKRVKPGDTIKLHYTGKLKNGRVFDSSRGKGPFEFTLGANQVITGFEEGVLGMRKGESKTLTIGYEKAYGAKRQDMVVTLPKSDFPKGIRLKLGQHMQLQPGNGQRIGVVITAINDTEVIIDGNHPLADKDLIFEIELIEILQKK
ncbi:MAG: peptidylprolyl isomerase [Candidatus Omnitrophica bacterium]|nr:peptidylprolyl isomerase [Candidatus Omnitrophota bacterium]